MRRGRPFGAVDQDLAFAIVIGGAFDGIGESGRHGARDREVGFIRGDADRADFGAGDMAAAAQQGQQPARIGVVTAPDVHLEPDNVIEPGAMAVGPARRTVPAGAVAPSPITHIDQFLGYRQPRAVSADQSGGDILGRLFGEQTGAQSAILVIDLDRREQGSQQPLMIGGADRFGGRRGNPFGFDPCAAQHHLDPAAALVGDNQDRSALFARAPGAPRTMLERFGVARHFDMDDQRQAGQIDPARGDVGRDAHPHPAVAQRLHRMVALGLAVLARQSDHREAAFVERVVQMADIVARRAKQQSGLGLVEAQDVDHGMLDIGRGDRDRLVGDVAMPAVLADGRDTQGVALIPLGQRNDRARHGRREQHRAAGFGGRVEDFLKLLAEAHVEHLVGFVEHHDLQVRQIKRAAFEVIAQAPRSADDDRRALAQRAAFLHRVHPADAGRDPRAGPGVEPV